MENCKDKSVGTRKLMELCNGIQHIGIPAADVEETCRFYEELGFIRVFETVIRGSQKVVFLQSGNMVLEIYEEKRSGREHTDPAGGTAAVDHIAVDCLDAAAAYELARARGYKIVTDGLEELPFWENGVRFFMIEGPNRERIEFDQRLG